MDEDFDYFLSKFGKPRQDDPIDSSTYDKYLGKLPDQLYKYWQKYGLCSFMFGEVYLPEPDTDRISAGETDMPLHYFFPRQSTPGHDVKDEPGTPLFARAVNKLGPLGKHEMFAFQPALFMGGAPKLESLAKVDARVQIALLAQFGHREILDLQGLARKAFG
jgi:hypothetical protein